MEMSNEIRSRVRYGEAFWRAHHEAWQQSALNQREYCDAQGIPLKAFGNRRAKFKAEPQPPTMDPWFRRFELEQSQERTYCHADRRDQIQRETQQPSADHHRA
jgi:hypothetical protein